MGVEHGGKHDKTEFAEWDEARLALLSLCFCQACQRRYAAAGVDTGPAEPSLARGWPSVSGWCSSTGAS
jgi:hypothetical protein